MKIKSANYWALVLKRQPANETDRQLTLLTREQGKIICLAKGVRRLTSSCQAAIEPGNLILAHLIFTKSWPILTQAKLDQSLSSPRDNLAQIRNLWQILEIFDKLFVEEELSTADFQLALEIRRTINHQPIPNNLIRHQLSNLVGQLGFAKLAQTKFDSIKEYVQHLVDRPLHSYDYLQVKTRP